MLMMPIAPNPANANSPHENALKKWGAEATETVIFYAESACGAFYPTRALLVEAAAKACLPGSLIRFHDGTTGYIALNSAVHKSATSPETSLFITKFGATSAQKYTRATLDKEVSTVIMGVLSSPGAPNQAGFKSGKAAAQVQHGGCQHYLAPSGLDEDGVGTVTVFASGLTEELTIGQAIGRYGLKWHPWLPVPPDGEALGQVPDQELEFSSADWINHEVSSQLQLTAQPGDEGEQRLRERRTSPQATALAGAASTRLFDAMKHLGIQRAAQDGGSLTLGSIASFIVGVFELQAWRNVTISLLASDTSAMHRTVTTLIELTEVVSAHASQHAWDLPGMQRYNGMHEPRVEQAAARLRQYLLGVPPPPAMGAPRRDQEPRAQPGAEQQQQPAPQRDAVQGAAIGAAGFDSPAERDAQREGVDALLQAAAAAGPQGARGGDGQHATPTQQMPPGGAHPTPAAHILPTDEQGGYPARLGASACREYDAIYGIVDTEFAPPTPAAGPCTDVQNWILGLGGEDVQKELASSVGRKLRPHLAPLGGVQAAHHALTHLATLTQSLIADESWAPYAHKPTDWEEAKARLSALLDAADGLQQRRLLQPHAPFAQRLDAVQNSTFDTAALAEGLVNGLKGVDMAGKRTRPTENTPTLAPAAVVRERGACAAGLARALCTDAVIDYEAALKSAADRGVGPQQELRRLTSACPSEAQATRALFAAGTLVTEKTGPLPVNVVDAVSGGRNLLRDQVRKARGGPMQRPDIMTPERTKRCDALSEGIAKGNIDLDNLVATLGGVEPAKVRPLAGEALDAGTDGDPKSRNDIRDAIDRLIDLLLTWWRDALGVDAGAGDDFGIRTLFKRNRTLHVDSLRKLLASGFAYTHERFMCDRESPQLAPPDVLGAWADAQTLDAQPLAQDQSVAAATQAHAKAALALMEGKLKAQQEQHKKEMAELARQIKAPPGTPRDKRPLDEKVETGPSPKRVAPGDEKPKGAQPPAPAGSFSTENDLRSDLSKALKVEFPTGNWPCLARMLSSCTRQDCRSCNDPRRTDKGEGDAAIKKALLARLKTIQDKNLLASDAAKAIVKKTLGR